MRLRCRGLEEKLCGASEPLTTKSLSAKSFYHEPGLGLIARQATEATEATGRFAATL